MLNIPLLIKKSHLQSGFWAADFGCGRQGHLSLALSQKTGEEGKVYAIDVSAENLADLHGRIKDLARTNIHPVWADVEKKSSVALPVGSLDTVFVVNLLWSVTHAGAVLAEAMRLLKPKGRLVVVDWRPSQFALCPPLSQLVEAQTVEKFSRERGFVVQEKFSASPYHWGMVLFRHD